MPQSEVMSEAERKMKNAIAAFQHELKTLRTGRASIALLESVKVPYYGTDTPIQQVANLSVSDATTLLVQPFDSSILGAVDKAIRTAELGLNPVADGKVIRVPIPKLTEERRKELVKKAHQMAEHARNEIRAHRRDGNDRLKKMGRDHKISEDEEKRAHDELQKLHDRYIDEVGATLSTKEKDILTV
jgi:ribosome recycling factor